MAKVDSGISKVRKVSLKCQSSVSEMLFVSEREAKATDVNYERETQLFFNRDENIGTYEASHHLEEFQFCKQASRIRLCLQWNAGLQQKHQNTQVGDGTRHEPTYQQRRGPY